MIEMRTLKNIPYTDIVNVFNLSFSDYFVPVKLTLEQFEAKLENENIRLDYSVGAFSDNKLIGLILHFYNESSKIKRVYNGGTGVIKDCRGQNLTIKMYEFILPILKEDKIDFIELEALVENTQAIKSYEKVGFEKVRKLKCFSGEIKSSLRNDNILIKSLTSYNWNKNQSFWDIKPTWQNSNFVIDKIFKINISYGAFIENDLVGYIIFNPITKRIQQISVDKNYRRKGIGTSLIFEIQKQFNESISIINVDDKSKETISFLENIGLKNTTNQFDFKLRLK